jgi:hypothetical protein
MFTVHLYAELTMPKERWMKYYREFVRELFLSKINAVSFIAHVINTALIRCATLLVEKGMRGYLMFYL